MNKCQRLVVRLETSFKKVKSKTALSNIGLLFDVPANDTVVSPESLDLDLFANSLTL